MMGEVYMSRMVGALLLLLLAMLLASPICQAQSDDDKEPVLLPPSWVFGSGYAPYDYSPYSYPGSVWGWDMIPLRSLYPI